MTEHRILQGDVMDGLRSLPDNCVQCTVTSPPYFALRDYGVDGQIGLEATPEEFIDTMVRVFREVRRVTRPDGVQYSFEIDAFRKHCLLHGLDDIGLTLQERDAIAAFEARHQAAQPWLFAQAH